MPKHTSHGGHTDGRESAEQKTETADNPGSGEPENTGINAETPDEAARPAEDTPAEAQAEEPAGGDPSPEERIAALEARLTEASDQYLRKAAEFENFRKRMNREKQEAIEFANQNLLLDLIPIMDDFERAIKAAEGCQKGPADFDTFLEGITMIEKRLATQLDNKWGLKRFDSAGEAFDPNRHEAIMMDKSAETAEPVVHEEFLKGYTLRDRIIRSAKVKVLMPEQEGQAAGEAADE
ncbi:MAG: nucleotide exchange factor GrpE [Treponema sp.]|nr:nucleotide exchange factor GrpE [Treponema sp.]